jgi:predicted Rossmann fold nucleotide-binding protein DprA/Smf involved in DNA uptake
MDMNKERALDAVMLSELPAVGERSLARVMALVRMQAGGLAEFFRLPAAVLRETYRLPEAAISRLTKERDAHAARCRWLLDLFAARGGVVWVLDDPAYPSRLRHRPCHPPPVLYALGNRAALDLPTVALLHSRTLGGDAIAVTPRLVQAAVADGFTVVSGGMKATHRIVAVAARALAAPRVIVLDRGMVATFGVGFDRDPFGLGPRRGSLDRDRTLVLSPFRMMDGAAPSNGQRRDELVAALADVVVAVHARPAGAIERICLEALDRGQCVLSWMGENAGLVAAGATVIEDADVHRLSRFVPQ